MSLFTIGFICAAVTLVAVIICCILIAYDKGNKKISLKGERPVQEPHSERVLAFCERMDWDIKRMNVDPGYDPLIEQYKKAAYYE